MPRRKLRRSFSVVKQVNRDTVERGTGAGGGRRGGEEDEIS